jgi:hypothetical protein
MEDSSLTKLELAKKNAISEKHNGCTYEWGNCIPNEPHHKDARDFGMPTQTPHQCVGGRKHASKMHICARCKLVGARMKPTKYTRAGREYDAFKRGAVKNA